MTTATIYLMSLLCGYEISGPDDEDEETNALLRLQKYDLGNVKNAYVSAVLIAGQRISGRVVSLRPDFVDLEDFHYARGLKSLTISHPDLSPIWAKEHKNMEASISESFGFDNNKPLSFKRSRTFVSVRFR